MSRKYNNDDFLDSEFTDEENEYFRGFLEYCSRERKRKKILMINPEKKELLDNVVEKMEFLLEQNGFEYELKLDHDDCFYDDITLNIDIEIFEVAPIYYHVFKDVANMVDSFSVSALTSGILRVSMGVKNVFIELKRK